MFEIMHLTTLTVLAFGFLYDCARGFNLDTKYPIVFENPHKNTEGRQSYFGFSVVLLQDQGGWWMLVGAPRANSSEKHLQGIIEPGVVFKCKVSKPYEGCHTYTVDPTGNEPSPPGGEKYNDHKDGAWIGGAMDVQDNGQQAVVCGHRWINDIADEYLMIGVCYGLRKNMDSASKLLPLVDIGKKYDSHKGVGVYYYGLGQAGISVHFPKKGKMIVGAPGVWNWEGMVIAYKEASLFSVERSNKRSSTNLFGETVIPRSMRNNSYNLFGYQVSSGNFFSSNLYYVASAPRGHDYKGKVLIFQMPEHTDLYMHVHQVLEGKSLGEYFGASLAVSDVNGDGLDDLIVGSPMYGEDEGRIYIFYGSNEGMLKKERNKIDRIGKIIGARFGTAVASLGDLDEDGYDDIVVAAPYEGRGAIYIYNGHGNGLSTEPSQYIKAEDISNMIHGFGISFSRPTDIDANNYRDIAVGSYLSGHIVLLRARPVIKLRMLLTSNATKIEQNDTSFSVKACILSHGLNIAPVNLSVMQIIEVDYIHRRGFLDQTSEEIFNKTVSFKESHCDLMKINLRKAADRNLLEPFTLSVSFSLNDNSGPGNIIYVGENISGTDNFNKYAPVERKDFELRRETFSIPFIKDCGNDNICSADLQLLCFFKDVNENGSYVIDSTKKLQLQIGVMNIGLEPAYGVKAIVNFSKPLYLSSNLENCEDLPSANTTWTAVSCIIGNRLTTSGKSFFTVNFNMEEISDETKYLRASIEVVTQSDDMNIENNYKNYTVLLITEADVTITGKSKDDRYTFSKTSTEARVFMFSHIYEVQKFGRSPIDEAEVIFTIPHIYKDSERSINILNIYRPKGTQDGDSVQCSSDITFTEDEEKVVQDTEIDIIRNKRSILETQNQDDSINSTHIVHIDNTSFDKNKNNITIINCDDSTFTCFTILCKTKPFYTTSTTAKILLKFQMNISEIVSVFGVKDIMLSTRGYVHITQPKNSTDLSNERPDNTVVSTTFSSIEPPKQTSTYIIVIAVIAGLLLFLLVTMGLVKAGFFRRKIKEELQTLKENEIAAEQEFHFRTSQMTEDDLQDDDLKQNDFYENSDLPETK